MPNIVIYHNPRCTKSRLTLELLNSKNLNPKVIEYLNTPPTKAELDDILNKLGMEPRDIMRTHEDEYKESGADNPDLSRDELIEKIVAYPKLLERPIVVTDEKAAIGRPPENIEAIL